jgi:hypothetical protein
MELSDSGSKGLELSDSYLAEKISQSLKEAEGGLELRFSGQFAKIPAIDELLEKVVEKANGSFSVWRSGQDTFQMFGMKSLEKGLYLKSYCEDEFETKALEIFDDSEKLHFRNRSCDIYEDGVLTGKELHQATSRMLRKSGMIRTEENRLLLEASAPSRKSSKELPAAGAGIHAARKGRNGGDAVDAGAPSAPNGISPGRPQLQRRLTPRLALVPGDRGKGKHVPKLPVAPAELAVVPGDSSDDESGEEKLKELAEELNDDPDRFVVELQKHFAAVLHIDMNETFGISREFVPAFARLLFAWRLSRLHTLAPDRAQKILVEKNGYGCAKLDVVFLGGAFVRRREDVLAKLFISHNGLFDFPIAYTDRPRRSSEIDDLHYMFISEEEFSIKESDTKEGFVFTYEEAGYRYGYLYADLVRANRERGGRVTLLPAAKTSAARARLQARVEAGSDWPAALKLNLVTICFAAPPQVVDAPPRSVAGSCTDFYAANHEEWMAEVAREGEHWDLFVAPGLGDAAAYDAVEAYLQGCLKAGAQKEKSAPPEEEKKSPIKRSLMQEAADRARAVARGENIHHNAPAA